MGDRSTVGVIQRERRVLGLLRILVPREIRVRYRRSLFDVLWALISPVVILVVYGLILTKSFSVTAACSPYLSSAWTGLVIWTFFASAVADATYSLLSANELVTKVYFPREALPLAVVGAALLDLVVGGLVAVVLFLIQGVRPGFAALWAVLPLLVLVLWSAVISTVVGIVSVFVRDLVHAVQLGLRVGFFLTPVMYETDFLPPILAWTAVINPVAVAIEGVRSSVLCSVPPDRSLLFIHLLVGVAAFVAVTLYTREVEGRIADVV